MKVTLSSHPTDIFVCVLCRAHSLVCSLKHHPPLCHPRKSERFAVKLTGKSERNFVLWMTKRRFILFIRRKWCWTNGITIITYAMARDRVDLAPTVMVHPIPVQTMTVSVAQCPNYLALHSNHTFSGLPGSSAKYEDNFTAIFVRSICCVLSTGKKCTCTQASRVLRVLHYMRMSKKKKKTHSIHFFLCIADDDDGYDGGDDALQY